MQCNQIKNKLTYEGGAKMKERIKLLREHLALNQREFSARINISQPTLALMEKGQRAIRDIHVAQICSEFNINENWLRTGEGKMFLAIETFSLDEQAKKSNLTELEIAIMRGYMNLDRNIREKLMNELEAIFKPTNNEDAATSDDGVDSETEAEVAEYRKKAEVDITNYRKEIEAEKKGIAALQESERKESG